ncbi:uncharacterized protein EV154DRAFT_605898 [Mucor mucedo]|uniref:uncharacterized protein n=1 Tax=Mucor mucedo TaxID=29922 RepID=UPI0022209295|nr:uncharacterized protein EV154DRAFT_605898 [Mucor mucedo]KAI7884132.1 hypothetical protein EV154DRAFT_605898 [Mucor mucedo]
MLYCACQLVSDDIASASFPCRVIAFVMIASDTMACMCLTMVGLNLVTIFVFKVSRSFKLELFYYFLIGVSGVMVVVIPLFMWYYGWLLFSLVFAAFCAAISIRFVMKKQDNFAGTLDMFTRRNHVERSQLNTLKKYTNNNTDIFTKIAIRCICYPLDPAIGAVLKDSRDTLKQKYVYDYYCVKYKSSSGPKSYYPRLVQVIRTAEKSRSIRLEDRSPQTSVFSNRGESLSSPLNISPFQAQQRHTVDLPSIEVYHEELAHHRARRYSVLSVTTVSGKMFLPNEGLEHPTSCFSSNVSVIPMRRVSHAKSNTHLHHQHPQQRHSGGYPSSSSKQPVVETLVPYKNPRTARCIHWVLKSVFKVDPILLVQDEDEEEEEDLPKDIRVFCDYTDQSHSSTPASTSRYISQSTDRRVSNSLKPSASMSVHAQDSIKEFPLRKVSSINVATLFRRKFRKEFLSTASGDETPPSTSSGKSRFAKILKRGRSFSRQRFTPLHHQQQKQQEHQQQEHQQQQQQQEGEQNNQPTFTSAASRPQGGQPTSVASEQEEASSATDSRCSIVVATDPFPIQLSPRPISPRLRKQSHDAQLASSIRKQHSLSLDGSLISLSQLFDGIMQEEATADDIIQPSGIVVPTQESGVDLGTRHESPVKQTLAPDEHEGFVEGNTTIEHISNWEEMDQIEGTRFNVYSESWDIEKQFKTQMSMAEDIAYM